MNFTISKIWARFHHHKAKYIHFSITIDENHDFLYILYDDHSKYSLFYGNNFQILIPKLILNPKIECIECALGSNIVGGVSWDTGDLVDFNLSIQNANDILSTLSQYINPKGYKFRYFSNTK